MAFINSARSAATFLRAVASKSALQSTDFYESTARTLLDEIRRPSQLTECFMCKSRPVMMKDRGFSRIAAPPKLQRQIGMKLYRDSAGILIEPYKPRTRLPFLMRWFTKEGWKQRKESILHELKTAYAVAKLRQTSGYTRQKFYSEASTMYKQINSAIANGDRSILRQMTTENMFSILKKELKQREGLWERVTWEAIGSIKIRTLQGRLGALHEKNLDNAFVQLTLSIQCSQKFAAYDKQGKLVAGDPDKQILVEDFWVFETVLGRRDKGWRLCARIS